MDHTEGSDAAMLPHPEFGLAALRSIRLPADWRTETTAHYLAHCVARRPENLLAHARRIALHASLNDDAGLAAAMTDLFIALGDKGSSLKRLMFSRHRDALKRFGCDEALAQALDQALLPNRSDIAYPGTILTRPVFGDTSFVLLRTDLAAASDDGADVHSTQAGPQTYDS